MKGKLLVSAVLAALLVGSNAFATIARQAVMGTQPVFTSASGNFVTNTVNGTLWVDDDYNVFYNPSYINDNKNYAVVEKGMEGGWFKSEWENFAYGVYANRGHGQGGGPEANNAAGLVSPGQKANAGILAGVPAASLLNTQRPIDFFFGGDTGMKWGVHVAWAYNRSQSGATQPNNGDGEISNRYWHVDFGMQFMGLEPFIGGTLSSKYQNTIDGQRSTQELNTFNAGFRYKYEGWTPYVVYNKYREGGNSSTPTQLQGKMSILGVGFGHDTKVADGVHIHKGLAYFSNSVEDDTGATEPAKDYRDMIIPINVALEAEATSWLTLRAGMQYDLVNQRKFARSTAVTTTSVNDKVASQAGTTNFRVGSTLKFGKLHVDSAFGTGSADTAATATGLGGTNAGFDSQTFALLSASYHW